MNLVSMLVPLETLPGWPPAPPVSVTRELLLLVGFPLLMGLIIGGIAILRPAQSAYDAMQEREALWVGSGAPEAVTERHGSRAAISAEQSSAGARRSSESASRESGSTNTGGASARW